MVLIFAVALALNGCASCRFSGADRASIAKLKSIVIERTDFRHARIRDIVEFYNTVHVADGAAVDPATETLLVLPRSATNDIPLVTFQATKLSLYESLRTTARLAGLTFKIKGGRPWLIYEEKVEQGK